MKRMHYYSIDRVSINADRSAVVLMGSGKAAERDRGKGFAASCRIKLYNNWLNFPVQLG